MEGIILAAKNLFYGYNRVPFISEVNLEIREGEFLGIVGPNGAGKSTLLKLLSRALKPDKGRVLLKGRDIFSLSPREVACTMAVVSQNPPLPEMTVEEFVLLGRIPHYRRFQLFETRGDREIAEESLKKVGIYALRNRPLQSLSGGERRLALLARALCQEPEILLLDELTAHLDVAREIKILKLLKNLNRENGLTVVAVLHHFNAASELCDRLVLMGKGRILADGPPEEVMDPERLGEVFGVKLLSLKNPVSGKPYLVPKI